MTTLDAREQDSPRRSFMKKMEIKVVLLRGGVAGRHPGGWGPAVSSRRQDEDSTKAGRVALPLHRPLSASTPSLFPPPAELFSSPFHRSLIRAYWPRLLRECPMEGCDAPAPIACLRCAVVGGGTVGNYSGPNSCSSTWGNRVRVNKADLACTTRPWARDSIAWLSLPWLIYLLGASLVKSIPLHGTERILSLYHRFFLFPFIRVPFPASLCSPRVHQSRAVMAWGWHPTWGAVTGQGVPTSLLYICMCILRTPDLCSTTFQTLLMPRCVKTTWKMHLLLSAFPWGLSDGHWRDADDCVCVDAFVLPLQKIHKPSLAFYLKQSLYCPQRT